jgi:hypothetical protein
MSGVSEYPATLSTTTVLVFREQNIIPYFIFNKNYTKVAAFLLFHLVFFKKNHNVVRFNE